jgi:hypothetical protein
MRQLRLGTFENKSGTLVVTDPAYDLGTWCQSVIENAAKGKWFAFVDKGRFTKLGIRCMQLHAVHEDALYEKVTYKWEESGPEICVDSANAGIFDLDAYPKGKTDDFIQQCYELTNTKKGAGVIEGGVVSDSGLGDGIYDVYVATDNDGRTVAVTIVFEYETW